MFYLLDKPKGVSSFSAIKTFAREKNIQKIGHTGTLDPLASGLLLVATDDDTKLIEYIDKGFKTYDVTMIVGKSSDTYDITGTVIKESKELPTDKEVINAIKSFVGKQDQMPPIFSAKKVNGQKSYELARKGELVSLKSVEVEIKEIFNINKLSDDTYTFSATVSRGTYIRSLVHDIGNKLQCGALMSELRRVKIGNLDLQSVNNEVNIFSLLVIPTIKTDKMKELLDGKSLSTDEPDGLYALEYKNDIFGIVKVEKKVMKADKLIGNKFRMENF